MKLQKYLTVLIKFTLCYANLFELACTASNLTDRLSLIKFRDSIVNHQDGVLSSWNDSVHFCEWPGITCSSRDRQRVTVLNLQLNNLRGLVSPCIGNLSFLRFLNLANNSFSGEIPAQVGRLFRLQHLKLDSNALEGPIPVNLSHCTQLRIINLGNNWLSGTIPSELGSLPRLSLLNLRVNRFTGVIPRSFGNISMLTQFSAAYNNLYGTIPDEFGRLRNLSILLLGVNNLSGVVPLSLYNVSSITVLTIASNRFHGDLPQNIGITLPNLQVFHIGGNRFSGVIPESFSNASELQQLDIGNNSFVGQVPTSFGKLANLNGLFFGVNGLGNYSSRSLEFIDSLTNCSQLQILDLNTNNFGGVLPNSVANLSTRLNILFLGLNQISGPIPGTLGNLGNLTILSLRDNLFTGLIPASLGKLGNVQLMSLASNALSGEIPSSIGNLSRIFKLYLGNNKLNGSIPRTISGCQSLQYLDISNNKLSGAIPEEVFYPPSYLFLDLSRNSLTGGLPEEVGNLKRMYNLNLSENNLNGVIPKGIKGCENIEYLFLQGNSFHGNLPLALVSLKGLQYLDLSRNNLTGEIPVGFENFRGMVSLNLSFNNLDGVVPSQGIFKNASLVSVEGNPQLCGGVPELHLQECPTMKTNQHKSHGHRLNIGIVCGVAVFLLIIALVCVLWRRRSERKQTSEISDIRSLSKVSYKVLYEATNGFSPSMLIGTGKFGSVYKGTLGQEYDLIAVKVFNLQQRGASKSFLVECNALRNIRHRNLVKILTCCSSIDYNGNEFKALVFEYMPNGSLDEWLHPVVNGGGDQSQGLNLMERLNIAIDVASAIYYLHEGCDRTIIHCDVKPSNVLIGSEMIARLSDFGLARLISNTISASENHTSTIGIKGTIGYVAPEYAMCGELSKQGDVYSYGILILEMFTGKRPTDECFKDDLNLHNMVKTALPEGLVQIVDSYLLIKEAEETGAMEKDRKKYSGIEHMEIDHVENSSKLTCLASIMAIGLACSEESPNQRISIGDASNALQRIRDSYVGFGMNTERQLQVID